MDGAKEGAKKQQSETIQIAELIAEHDDGLETPTGGNDAPTDAAYAPTEEATPAALGDVRFAAIPCGGPVYSYFVVPMQAYPYTCRFVFVNAAGARKYSPFYPHNRSEYPPSVIYAKYPGRVPAGTTQVWAYWRCGTPTDHDPASPHWNHKNVNC